MFTLVGLAFQHLVFIKVDHTRLGGVIFEQELGALNRFNLLYIENTDPSSLLSTASSCDLQEELAILGLVLDKFKLYRIISGSNVYTYRKLCVLQGTHKSDVPFMLKDFVSYKSIFEFIHDA